MRHGRSPKRCNADQPLISEGLEIAYDVALASRPEAIVASVARTDWSAGGGAAG